MEKILMTPHDVRVPGARRTTARRFALLASVAAIGGGLLIGGPSGIASFAATAQPPVPTSAPAHPAGFADLVAKVKPAVISVSVKIDRTAETTGSGDGNVVPFGNGNGNGAPLDKFFQQFGFGDAPKGLQRHRMVKGEGSGFFISSDGYAVTNNHVVDHATSVEVKTDDGKTYTAKVIGTDPKTDIALIKVDADNSFPYVAFSNNAPRVGDWVVAVGNPFGLGGTVTAGIVSARGRDIGAGPYDDYIQIDAPINKGNSGGPAFDVDGNVIGVNTAIFSPSGGSVGIGFDIPAETAKMVVAQLKDKGFVTRGWIGVQVQPVTQDVADSLGMKQARGALVDEPQPNSPAAKAGIKAGDVITAVNGTAIKDSRELARRISETAPGTAVKLDVMRNGESTSMSVTLAKMPDQQQAKAEPRKSEAQPGPHLGLQLAPAKEVAGAGETGVVVMGIDPDGPAAEHGIKSGDVIMSIGDHAVANVGDVRNALAAARQGGKKDVLMK